MEDNTVSEENEAVEAASGGTGNLTLNGEAWKSRNQKTYTSLLDQYGVSDLFSARNTERYRELQQEKGTQHQELIEYVFSGRMQTKGEEEDLVELIFSKEIQFSRIRDYSRDEEDYSMCFVLAEFLFVLLFIYILMKINAGRRKRREPFAAEIDMESERPAGYGPAGV